MQQKCQLEAPPSSEPTRAPRSFRSISAFRAFANSCEYVLSVVTESAWPSCRDTVSTAVGRTESSVGSVIYRRGDDPNLRVIELVVHADDPEVFGVFVVEPA